MTALYSLSPAILFVSSCAAFYVITGTIQPLVVTLMKEAGLADPNTQIDMLAYYLVPALFIFPLVFGDKETKWPNRFTILKSCFIAVNDVIAQTLNYTGASMSGPTIFAIVYASVTIWSAVFSQILLGRKMNASQWVNVVVVFIGLGITATDSVQGGSNIWKGSCLIMLGSAMHGLTYVLNEGIMTVGEQKLSILQNSFVQSVTNSLLLLIWQIYYTLPHFNELIWTPMRDAQTTILYGSYLFILFGVVSVIHTLTQLVTLKRYPGGATSAGVMKGLQAVLVFVCTDRLYCNKVGGPEMCFSRAKFISLITVAGGVFGYSYTTEASKAPPAKETEIDETTKLIAVA